MTESASYKLWVNEARTILFRVWSTGEAEVAMRPDPSHTWGPPQKMERER